MPVPVVVTGSFIHKNGRPVRGRLRFTPCRMWVIQDGVAWATLAPEVTLEQNGSFSVQVTPTDSDDVQWCYTVDTPAGRFWIAVPSDAVGYTLKELIDEHRSGSRTTD